MGAQSDDSLAHVVPPEQWAARVRELRAERDQLRAALDFIADGNASLVRDALLHAKLCGQGTIR